MLTLSLVTAGRPDMPDPRPAAPTPAPVLPRVAAGDATAVRVCLERYGRLVFGMARRWLGSDADAEDATQEVFIELWKAAARFDPRAASELTFVAMITRRKLIDRHRRRAARPPEVGLPGPLPDEVDLTPAWELEDELARVRAVLAELPPVQQRVLLMALSDGVSHTDIAEQTGLPLGTVKTHIRRGLIYARERLAGGVS
jgi:RNA polymerase sigma factor (sigma-70 family)